MSLSVKTNRLLAVNRLGENTLQTVLQGKVDLPSTAAPIGRVVWMKGSPVVHSFTTEQDHVYIKGAIDLSVIYEPETLQDEQDGLRRVEWPSALPFDHSVDVIGAEPGMFAEVDVEILVCEWDLLSGQYSLDVDLVLASKVKVYEQQEQELISELNFAKPAKLNTDGVVLKPLAKPFEVKVAKEITGMLDFPSEETALPANVLQAEANVVISEAEVKEGKVLLQGTTNIEILYEAEDYTVQNIRFSGVLPFEFSFENSSIDAEASLKHKLKPICLAYVVNDGKNFRVEVELEGQLYLQKNQSVQILTDIHAPGHQIEVRKELLGLDNFVTEKEHQAVVRGLLELPERLPPMRELLNIEAFVHVLDYQVDEDKLVIAGVSDIEFFYLAHSEEDTKPLYWGAFLEAISFEQTIAVPGLEPGMQPEIEVRVVKVEPDLINRETVELALTLRCEITVVEYLELELAVEAVEVEPRPEEFPSLTYVFVQTGDSLWKLARQYHSDEKEILELNPSLQGDPKLLKPGDRLYIPR